MPKEQSKKVRIEPNLYQRLLDEKPTYLSITAFTGIVIDKGLDACDTLIKPSAPEGPRPFGADGFISKEIDIDIKEEEKKKKTKLPFSTKRLDPELIPAELQNCSDQIIEFWSVKKGTRSEGAATRLFNKLLAMGPSDRIKALNAATDSGWATVFEPKADTPAHTRANSGYTQPEFKHPAHQVFTAQDFQ